MGSGAGVERCKEVTAISLIGAFMGVLTCRNKRIFQTKINFLDIIISGVVSCVFFSLFELGSLCRSCPIFLTNHQLIAYYRVRLFVSKWTADTPIFISTKTNDGWIFCFICENTSDERMKIASSGCRQPFSFHFIKAMERFQSVKLIDLVHFWKRRKKS